MNAIAKDGNAFEDAIVAAIHAGVNQRWLAVKASAR